MLPLRPIQGGCLCTSQDPGRFRSPRTTEADSTVPLTSAFPAWLLPHLSALPWGTRLGHTSLAAHTGFLTLSWPQFSSVAQSSPTPTPGVYPNSCPLSWWCHPAISYSVVPFSSCPQSLPASGSFPMNQLFACSGQSIRVSASTSVLPMNTQD